MKPAKVFFSESTYPTAVFLGHIQRHPSDEKTAEKVGVNYSDLSERDDKYVDSLEIFITEKNPINFREPLASIVTDYEVDKFPQHFILERPGEDHVYFIESDGKVAKGVICIRNFTVGFRESVQNKFQDATV